MRVRLPWERRKIVMPSAQRRVRMRVVGIRPRESRRGEALGWGKLECLGPELV